MPEFVNPFTGKIPDQPLTKGELLRALRLSLAAEEEAVHIYDAIADACTDELARAVLRDVAEEERVHKGEFQKLIELLSPEESSFMQKGASEVEEIKQSLGHEHSVIEPRSVGNLKKRIESKG
ncbi:MAG: Rubrerythrin [Fibrobacter sp.]|nr:Rubrerythrin [Fibrobacter sp.]